MEPNTQERLKDLESAFSGEAAVAEEPAVEATAEEAQEAQPKEDDGTVDGASDGATAQSSEEAEGEEKEPFETAEDGAAVFNLEGDEEAPEHSEDVTSLKEQIKVLLEEKEERSKTPVLDPRIEKMQRWVEQGGQINQAFWELQSKSYKDLDVRKPEDALSVMRDKLRYTEGLEQDEADYYLKKNFPLTYSNEEDADEDDLKDERMKLRMDAKNALPALSKFQEQILLPEVDNGQAQEEEQRQVSMYRAESGTKLDEIESMDFELDAEHKLRFPFKGKAKQQVKAIVTEPENQAMYFQKKYKKEDGSIDYGKWARSEFILDNFQGIAQAIFKLGGNSQKKAMIQELQGENAGTPLKAPKNQPQDKWKALEKIGMTT